MLCDKQWCLTLQMLLVWLMFLVFLVGTGCVDETDSETAIEGPPPDSITEVQGSASVSGTDIIVDATPSMKGFTDTGNSRYQNFLTLSLANASIQNSELTYYQLTTAVPGGIRAVDSKMQVAQPAFYASGNTDLQTALDSLAPDRLTVLITDLFQSNADMNAVSRSIIRQAFAEGMALGVVGTRLPFEGIVYDLGPNSRSFAYEGERPVYGLVFGAPRAVSTYLDDLRRYVSPEEHKFLVFSPRIAERSAWASVRSTDTTKNLVRVKPRARTPLPRKRTFGIRIRDNSQLARLGAKFSMKVLSDTRPLLDPSVIEARVTEAWKYDDKEGRYVQEFEGRNTAGEAFQARVVQGDGTDMLRLKMSPQDLQRGKYAFNLATEVREWRMPEWVSSWNLPPSQFEAETPDGSKTANLRPFLLDIGSSLTNAENPQVGTFQAYVEKRR